MKTIRIMQSLSEVYKDICGISYKVAFQKIFVKVKKKIGHDKDLYAKFVYSYILKNTLSIVDRYRNYIVIEESGLSTKKFSKIPIWVCWWQGEDEMPTIIKCCYYSLKRNIPNDICEIHLITLENYKQYINLPKYITDKVDSKEITYTHFSDILRFSLLCEYGGLWVDSTIYLSKPLARDIFNMSLFTHRRIDPMSTNISGANWATYIIGGERNHRLFRYLKDALYDYWEKHDNVIDYYMLDYMIAIAYNEIEYINKEINKIPYNNPNIFSLNRYLNEPYGYEKFYEINRNTEIYKLSYKQSYIVETLDGEKTFYWYILKEFEDHHI